ncbi:DEAD/DEAH box helicase [bacterium]|nr:DEAD/DEAH box helicase [bacterium]
MKRQLSLLPSGSFILENDTSVRAISEQQREIEDLFEKYFHEDPCSALFYLGVLKGEFDFSPSLAFWRGFAHEFTEKLRLSPDIETVREKGSVDGDRAAFQQHCLRAPFMQGAEYLTPELLEDIWSDLNSFFQRSIGSFTGSVEDFYRQYVPDAHLLGKVYFHLVENKKRQRSPFVFLATYAATIGNKGSSKHRPLKHALSEYEKDEPKLLELLSTVKTAAQRSPFIADLLEKGELFYPLLLRSDDAYTFLMEVPLYEEAGILCRIPNWWKRAGSRASVSVTVGNKKNSLLGLESLIDFTPELVLDDLKLSEAEMKRLLEESEGLRLIKGKWVQVNHDQLRNALKSWEHANDLVADGKLSLSEAVRLLMAPELALSEKLEESSLQVSTGKWLASLFEKMQNPELVRSVSPGKDFAGKLRPYQQNGLNWLLLLDSLGLGACLADDMGLGKTVQILSFLNILRRRKERSSNLLVVPASLVSNWISEIEKFSPKLTFKIAHPSGGESRLGKECEEEELEKVDLVITTYSLVKRYQWMREFEWNYVILDEAQAIKNSGTAQTRAIKKIKSKNRIALTGTPIENRVSDLWSLFDFLNPGLLGTAKEFESLCKDRKGESPSYSKIRAVTNPYILRRLKTDKTIISDLPDKVEVDTYATLSKEQVVLYKQLVKDLKESIEEADGIQRRGLVLGSLMKFKQLCNHPSHYLGQEEYKESQSGKFQRLREICETISEKREKVLIFTQFREITGPLADFLETIFSRRGLILTGSTSVKKRKELVSAFQSDEYIPYFILSLKAGGTGLNLTAANHVVHFDRWWNPAVENQATDRAFRIGQKRNVMVHKLVTKETIEEKIATMLKEKSKLSSDIIGLSADKLLTKMSDSELIDMFRMEAA